LLEQALDFCVPVIGLTSPPAGGEAEIRRRLAALAAARGVSDPVEVIHLGDTAAEAVAGLEADMVLNAITGAAGLGTTLAALARGTDVALANKESLIIGGSIVLDAARATGARLVPVDSEHSAIAQALRGRTHREVRQLIIAASGGPFRGLTRDARRPGPQPPDLVDGGDDHPQLRDPGQQGPGSHRGPPALRDRLRPHRGRRPPAIAHPLDGRVHRRLDDRADLPTGHASAHLLRSGHA